jgi:LysM repeat protein
MGFMNQTFMHSRLMGLAAVGALALGLAACASGSGRGRADSTADRTAESDMISSQSQPDAEEMATATEYAAARASEREAAPVVTQDAINPQAPRNYTVKRGDTLWDIASMFLRDPWLWPEIWQVNPQVQNPHLIYPGDVLGLVYGADGRPSVILQQGGAARLDPRLRSSPIEGAIATIPYEAIAAFLTRPSVLSKELAKLAPRVLAFRDGHMAGGSGIETYVRGLPANTAERARYSVVHVGEPIRDPDDGDVLGYMGVYSATAIVMNNGDPGKVALTDSARETLEGDRLIASDTDVPTNFMPRSPARDVNGQIIAVVDDVTLIGQYFIVAINRGRRHGLEVGHVLAIDHAGETVRDRRASALGGLRVGSSFAPKVKLPNERAATMLVFKVYDRMSYGLIVAAEQPVRVADVVRTP